MLTLYFAPGGCSLAPHIALEEAGAEYEARKVDFAANEQRSAEYLAINPKGRVPALVTPRGILTETPAILAYIAQSFPGAALAPVADFYEFAEMQAFNAYLSSTLHVAHAHGVRGTRWADAPEAIDDMKRKMPEVVTSCFEMVEQKMLRGPWVMGKRYTVADAYLFTVAQWIEKDQVDTSVIPRVLEHRERMKQRPAVAKVLAREAAA
ncbi:glutathione S-transferase family protein [Aquamicrobium zhengzhouense]|uniref:Glutathione S-transferase N-terminal domain-containing protein n=1 Tax=Aquamicrobium zhengzhouense TaxID=2781738 RepID=A0ABS0S9M7_9HYPH|nr:glutathione S-transferase N-terminal domain-containing protein [Aquamicrobium zhengzhouense]MBI1619995.1 glutathione S-transferase N-terminal domain-containing protein [Aquamicrobium zhengzhouense]